jgi:hypothetical protein
LLCAPSAASAGASAHAATSHARASIALKTLRMRTSFKAGDRPAKHQPSAIFPNFETAN